MAFEDAVVAPLYERRRRRSLTGATVPSAVYKEIVTSGPHKLADLMQALLAFLGRNDMMAYLVMMAIRLAELHLMQHLATTSRVIF